MKENKEIIETIKDCKTLDDIRKGIDSIMDQHDIMQARVKDYELTCSSMIESLMWFLDPVESKGRKSVYFKYCKMITFDEVIEFNEKKNTI